MIDWYILAFFTALIVFVGIVGLLVNYYKAIRFEEKMERLRKENPAQYNTIRMMIEIGEANK